MYDGKKPSFENLLDTDKSALYTIKTFGVLQSKIRKAHRGISAKNSNDLFLLRQADPI